jgi:hypothetical protein
MMSDHLPRIQGAASCLRGAMKTPLGNLSCPYSQRDAARRDPWPMDYWNPPVNRSQHGRQRVLALIVAFGLAALLAHAGW